MGTRITIAAVGAIAVVAFMPIMAYLVTRVGVPVANGEIESRLANLERQVADRQEGVPESPSTQEMAMEEKTSSEDPTQRLIDTLDSLSTAVAVLQSDMEDLRRRVALSESESPDNQIAGGMDDDGLDSEENRNALEEYIRQESGRLRSEQRDNVWADAVTDAVEAVIIQSVANSSEFETSLDHVECGTTLCRVELTHRNLMAAETRRLEMLPELVNRVSGIRPMRQVNPTTGLVTEILLLSRRQE